MLIRFRLIRVMLYYSFKHGLEGVEELQKSYELAVQLKNEAERYAHQVGLSIDAMVELMTIICHFD